MPRIPNTRPTSIYWLVDMRPETIARGYAVGYPFYCGKTVKKPRERLHSHYNDAKAWPARKLSGRLIACGRHIRVVTVETVPTRGNWAEREREWIKTLRFSFPDNCNVSNGGQGSAGNVPSAATRAKLSAALKNRTPPNKGRKLSRETRERIRIGALRRWGNAERVCVSTGRKIKKLNLAKVRKDREMRRTASING